MSGINLQGTGVVVHGDCWHSVSSWRVLTCEGHGVLVLSGDLENTFLLFFFMDGEALQSCFIFKALDVLNEGLFFCVNKGKDTPQSC